MKINLAKAIKAFYPNPSFNQIYNEAIANSIDAYANEISINVYVPDSKDFKSMVITIEDNGVGFTDSNFERFSELLRVESEDHKGLGRLVYLAYFDRVLVDSCFDHKHKRTFIFNCSFKGKSKVVQEVREPRTRMEFRGFIGKRLHSHSYIKPSSIKTALMKEFMPTFFSRAENNQPLTVKISSKVKTGEGPDDNLVEEVTLSTNELPDFQKTTFEDSSIDFFQKIDIYYRIKNEASEPKSILTAICVDGRAINIDLMPLEAVPPRYQLEFFFVSDYFVGKTNASRQRIELPDEVTDRELRTRLRTELRRIIESQIPSVIETNEKIVAEIDHSFPHLKGYFRNNVPGVIVKPIVIEEAQREFFSEQRSILDCETLTDSQYEKAIEHSARSLMEYVMYRARIIERLKTRSKDDPEDALHNIIVPKRSILSEKTWDQDYFKQNIWLLDDKYMSYDTLLSDQELKRLKGFIEAEDEQNNEGRPDLAIVFSSDPNAQEKFSVVVAEIKKEGIPLAKQEEVVSQIKQRARRLLQYYPNKIERIWFFAITEISGEFRLSLKENQYREFFSFGQLFYNQQPILLDENSPAILVDVVIMDYDALVKDAEARNETFMKILRNRISDFVTSDRSQNNETGGTALRIANHRNGVSA